MKDRQNAQISAVTSDYKPDLRAQESGAVHLVELLAKTLFFSQRSSYLDASISKRTEPSFTRQAGRSFY